jgi:hypothetical protein
MSINKILLTGMALALSNHHSQPVSAYYDEMCKTQKFKYVGLSKNSPSHAQQKRDAKKAKRNGSK